MNNHVSTQVIENVWNFKFHMRSPKTSSGSLILHDTDYLAKTCTKNGATTDANGWLHEKNQNCSAWRKAS